MRIIITGGSGLLGRALTERLTAGGYEVIVLSRSPEKVTGLPTNARAVAWDGRTADGWAGLADGAEAIVNLAGASIGGEHFLPSRWTPARKKLLRESRTDAGAAVVEAVARAAQKPRVVLQSSAIGYYGIHGDEKLDENDPPGDDFLASVCVDWEACTAPVEAMGVRRVITRTGLVLTTKGGALTRVILPYRLFAGGRMGSGRQWWSWIHLEDQLSATLFLLENSQASGIFNLTSPQPVTNNEFGKTLGKVLHRPHLIPLPNIALRALVGEVAMVVMEGQRVLPVRLAELGYRFRCARLEPALIDIVRGQSK